MQSIQLAFASMQTLPVAWWWDVPHSSADHACGLVPDSPQARSTDVPFHQNCPHPAGVMEELVAEGAVIVTTSNRPPWELQDHGLHEVWSSRLPTAAVGFACT